MNMTPESAKALASFFLADWERERNTTRNVIAAVPADKPEWKPDDKSMGALYLAYHIASADEFFLNGVANRAFNPGGDPGLPENIKTPQDVVTYYDESFSKAAASVAAMTGEQLAEPVDFFGMMKVPNVIYLSLGLKHMVHHRGQLSTYLRPMGGKCPSIYGPSADVTMEMLAAGQGA